MLFLLALVGYSHKDLEIIVCVVSILLAHRQPNGAAVSHTRQLYPHLYPGYINFPDWFWEFTA